jgi:hypothetical protein
MHSFNSLPTYVKIELRSNPALFATGHSAGRATLAESAINGDESWPAVRIENSAERELIHRNTSDDVDTRMPPKDAQPLNATQIALLPPAKISPLVASSLIADGDWISTNRVERHCDVEPDFRAIVEHQ